LSAPASIDVQTYVLAAATVFTGSTVGYENRGLSKRQRKVERRALPVCQPVMLAILHVADHGRGVATLSHMHESG
jgi:hypothetical protein